MFNKSISLLCMGALFGATMLSSAAMAEGTWQQGGLATNQVSKGTAKTQEAITKTLASIGLISNAYTFIAAHWPALYPDIVVSMGAPPEIPPIPGEITGGGWASFGLNFDLAGAALDGVLLHDAHSKNAKWSKDPENLESQIRQMGSAADLMGECEGDESGKCNETNATLDGTEVHIKTLKNVGLEALEDVAGSVLTSPAELAAAGPVIQTGFGSEGDGFDSSSAAGKITATGVISYRDYLTDYGKDGANEGTRGTAVVKKEKTEQEVKDIRDRKLAHLQLTGTAGVSRADMGATVARSEKEAFDRLHSYVGSGDGLIANIKVLCGLDLTLTQRINMLNMLQGQQVANEAASALQFIGEDE